jgi:ABC-2 type transport system permease protein
MNTSWGPGVWLGIYRAHLKMAIALMLQYRFAVIIWAVWGFVGPLLSLAVWSATSAARGGSVTNAANGVTFDRADFAAYFLTFMIFGHLTMSWDAFEFAFRVRTGQLSPHLLKPIHPIHRDAAHNMGFKLSTSMMLFPIWILLFILLKPTPPQSGVELALAVPALILAGITRYVLQYALAAIAFWTTRVEAVNQFYFALDAFLSGSIAPLALLPAFLGTAAYFSPFRGMGSFPVELALGRIPPEQILPGFGLQLFWLTVTILFFRAVWAAGIKQYSAVGA